MYFIEYNGYVINVIHLGGYISDSDFVVDRYNICHILQHNGRSRNDHIRDGFTYDPFLDISLC